MNLRMLENNDLEVLETLVEWMLEKKNVWLATVTKTWGSSPRPIGSTFCCNEDGKTMGSLSGGCVEEDLVDKIIEKQVADNEPEVILYGKTKEESDRFGLPCGGQLEVVIEPQFNERNLKAFLHIRDQLKKRLCVLKTTDLKSGEVKTEIKNRFSELELLEENQKVLKHTLGPRFQLFLIGAGQVSQYLAQIAKMLDYHVLVCDPREDMIEQFKIEGVQLISGMPDDAINRYVKDEMSAIVALTHDPRIDDMGLMQALKTSAFFIGAMGSKKTSEKRRERLMQLDLSKAEIDRLHAPVGLPIGSKTPSEIAISIIAQLSSIRNQSKSIENKERHSRESEPN